jgi:hypothetical protein
MWKLGLVDPNFSGQEAVRSYKQFLSLDLSQQDPKQIEFARKRLLELGE